MFVDLAHVEDGGVGRHHRVLHLDDGRTLRVERRRLVLTIVFAPVGVTRTPVSAVSRDLKGRVMPRVVAPRVNTWWRLGTLVTTGVALNCTVLWIIVS